MSSRTGSKGSKPPFLSLWSLKPCCWACLWHANMEENSRFMSAWALEVAGLTMGVVTRPHCSRVMWKLMRWTGWWAARNTLLMCQGSLAQTLVFQAEVNSVKLSGTVVRPVIPPWSWMAASKPRRSARCPTWIVAGSSYSGFWAEDFVVGWWYADKIRVVDSLVACHGWKDIDINSDGWQIGAMMCLLELRGNGLEEKETVGLYRFEMRGCRIGKEKRCRSNK